MARTQLYFPIIIIIWNQTLMDDKITSMDDSCCDNKSNEPKKCFWKENTKKIILFLQNLYRYKFEVTFL
jgi:hypothetical protein